MNRNSTVAASSFQAQFSRISAGSNAKKNCSSDTSSKNSPTSMGHSEYSMNGVRANSSSWNTLPLTGYPRLLGRSVDGQLLQIYTDHFEKKGFVKTWITRTELSEVVQDGVLLAVPNKELIRPVGERGSHQGS